MTWWQKRLNLGGLKLLNAKMNVHILKNGMAMQRRNDQKVTSHAHAKTQCERDKLMIIAQ